MAKINRLVTAVIKDELNIFDSFINSLKKI